MGGSLGLRRHGQGILAWGANAGMESQVAAVRARSSAATQWHERAGLHNKQAKNRAPLTTVAGKDKAKHGSQQAQVAVESQTGARAGLAEEMQHPRI